jgi:hypothetical protein
MIPPTEPAGVFLVRAWVEGNHSSGLRARIIHTRTLDSAEQIMETSVGVDETCHILRTWLQELLDAASV